MSARRIDAGGPVIVGAGLAGLTAAIELAPLPCLVLSAGALGTATSTGWAQGGIAAAVGADDDPATHAADTMAAGAGLCDPDVVRRITAAAPGAISWLAAQGARFDTRPDGSLKLGLEGAHSRRRIVHFGDGTGAEVHRAVVERAATLPSITVWEHCVATAVLTDGGGVTGVRVATPSGDVELLTDAVVLATGGVGGLFSHTTNPLGSRGQGLALAFRAGAALRDLELVQFHPTALDVGLDPMPLVSEAVRGEGAILVNEDGERVLDNPLAARDVVARAEWAQLRAGHRVFLDARENPGARFAAFFPGIAATAAEAGIDAATDLLPVRPAAHYHMGGVLVDGNGESTVRGLYAAGEVASTGLHGANRLASNSLLEAVVCGRWVARHLRRRAGAAPAGGRPAFSTSAAPGAGRPGLQAPDQGEDVAGVRSIMSRAAGVLRSGEGLTAALDELAPLRETDSGLVAWLVVWSALQRRESRGGHTRLDFPGLAEARHTVVDAAALLQGRAA